VGGVLCWERRSNNWHVLVRFLHVEEVFRDGETNEAGIVGDRFLESYRITMGPVVIAEVFEEAGKELVWLQLWVAHTDLGDKEGPCYTTGVSENV